MPYVNRRLRNRKMRVMRRPRRAPAKKVALKALRLAKQTARKEEVKFVEWEEINRDMATAPGYTVQNLVPIGVGGNIFCASAVAQGTAEGQRIGEKISPTSLSYRYQIGLTGSASEGFLLRTIVFMDRQQVTNPPTVPTVANILEDPRPQSHYTRELQPRFKIFHDKTITVNRENSAQRVTRLVRGYVRFPKWLQTYFTGSGVTSLMRNQIYILQIATQFDGSVPGQTVPIGCAYITIQTRFNYKDA